MTPFWYSSYVYLGLSLAIGILVYLVYRDIKRKREERRRKSPLRELEEQYLKKHDTGDEEPDESNEE